MNLLLVQGFFCRAAITGLSFNCKFGSTISQAIALSKQKPAAAQKDISHPKCFARNGVKLAVVAPLNWPPIFISPERDPVERPPRSELTVQNAL